MSLLTGAPRTATARAATAVTVGKVSREAFNHLMEAYPALHDNVWHEFAKRAFDNHVRGRNRFAHLDHAKRIAWYELGRSVVLERGGREELRARDDFAFVLTGRIRAAALEHAAPTLVDVDAAGAVEALEPSRVILLPSPLADREGVPSGRASLSSAGVEDALEA